MKKAQNKTKITTWNLGVFRRQVIREYPSQTPSQDGGKAPKPPRKRRQINIADRLIEAALPRDVRRQQDLKRLEQRLQKQQSKEIHRSK